MGPHGLWTRDIQLPFPVHAGHQWTLSLLVQFLKTPYTHQSHRDSSFLDFESLVFEIFMILLNTLDKF